MAVSQSDGLEIEAVCQSLGPSFDAPVLTSIFWMIVGWTGSGSGGWSFWPSCDIVCFMFCIRQHCLLKTFGNYGTWTMFAKESTLINMCLIHSILNDPHSRHTSAFGKFQCAFQIKSNVVGTKHIFSRCYCGCSEMLVFLAPIVQYYLSIHNNTPNLKVKEWN